ncbi:hypothetical protein MJG53_006805 [Ovis ammon polii x Ovis aries]|uniref:Uncharacterized protein n=1 Tax=Ovis ammon polii x Ovis aries TaxID=2918886 RepID=A0ACB9V5S3_9CETA|nr:hypothetical protein MJG53_006805 [Ovis ammon polii x Ovis aries]
MCGTWLVKLQLLLEMNREGTESIAFRHTLKKRTLSTHPKPLSENSRIRGSSAYKLKRNEHSVTSVWHPESYRMTQPVVCVNKLNDDSASKTVQAGMLSSGFSQTTVRTPYSQIGDNMEIQGKMAGEKSGEDKEPLHDTEVHCDRVCFSALHSGAGSIPISAQFLTLHHGRQDRFALKES